jgi:hypothetical protein
MCRPKAKLGSGRRKSEKELMIGWHNERNEGAYEKQEKMSRKRLCNIDRENKTKRALSALANTLD